VGVREDDSAVDGRSDFSAPDGDRPRREHPRIGSHSLAPLSFRGATYSGVFTLQPLFDDVDRAHHGAVLREANAPIDTGLLRSQVDAHRFTLESVKEAHELLRAGANPSKVVVDVGHD
jgi:NADPH:quinone reductase